MKENKPTYVFDTSYANEIKRTPKNMIDNPKSQLLEVKSKLTIANPERKKEQEEERNCCLKSPPK